MVIAADYRFRIKDLSKRQIEILFQLLATDIGFITCAGGFTYSKEDIYTKDFTFSLLVNDHFCPAADSEDVIIQELEGLYESVVKHGDPYQWTADKRGIPNECWKVRYEKKKQKKQTFWSKLKGLLK